MFEVLIVLGLVALGCAWWAWPSRSSEPKQTGAPLSFTDMDMNDEVRKNASFNWSPVNEPDEDLVEDAVSRDHDIWHNPLHAWNLHDDDPAEGDSWSWSSKDEAD